MPHVHENERKKHSLGVTYMPSYAFRMVFLVERNRGQRLSSAYSKQDCAKPATLSSVLNLQAVAVVR